MKASEILHGLADLLAGIETGQSAETQAAPQIAQPQASLTPVQPDNTDGTNNTTMVPPLQQKIELLKKSLNVDNEFDQGFDQIDQEQESRTPADGSDLERMKQMAGIKPQQVAAQQELANDDPIDG
jgi:hypothetical protein